jgi:hypothetical protein
LRGWSAASLAACALAVLAGCTTRTVTVMQSAPSSTSPASAAANSPTGVGAASSGGAITMCVTSAASFNCGPFTYPQVQGTTSPPTVGNNVWAPVSGWQQTLYAASPGNWHVVANMPDGNTAVVSYPSSSAQYDNRALSSFSSISSAFSETMNATGATSAWAAYDIWINNGKNEVMIQHDFANNGACGAEVNATFGGSAGVPVQNWYLCQFGSELVWKLRGANEHSGTVDILAMLRFLQNHGYLPQNSTLASIGYGWEIASTGGQPETFTVSRYSISVP